MKLHWLTLVCIVVSVALVVVMKTRKTEQEKEVKKNMYVDVKLRVTHDVLEEYLRERETTQTMLARFENQQKVLEDEVNVVNMKTLKARGDLDSCKGDQKSERDELAILETEYNNLKAAADKEVATLNDEQDTLKRKLAAQSSVCDFLKKDSQEGSKLCGKTLNMGAPKQEEPKPEAPKQEEPKPEAPKQEDPKPEAPKQKDPKPEAPKQEEPKPEAPKQ